MLQNIKLKYGDKEKIFSCKGNKIKKIIQADNYSKDDNKLMKDIVKSALSNPDGSKKLSEIVNKDDKVTIVISDITRSWQKIDKFLPYIIDEITAGGVELEDITILAATGSHRSHTNEEIDRLLGKNTAGKIKFVDHNCYDKDNLKFLGKTSFGTPVYINKAAVDADKLILTGGIVFHDMAGWAGGRKSILPGIAGYETIMSNHSLTLNSRKVGGIKDDVRSGNFDNNPVHLDMMEAAEMIPPDFIFNVIPDGKGGIAAAVAGDYKKAHKKGCKLISDMFGIKINKKADLVIASCGGFPKDINLYQASKALVNAAAAVKNNGCVILMAECREGIGHPEVEEIMQKYENNFLREDFLRKKFSISRYTGYLITKTIENIKFILISDLEEKYIDKTDIILVNTLEEALAEVEKWPHYLENIYVMPDAANTLPVVES
ncbi:MULTISPECIES: nickel-dependent lactate racemase [unclassified Halanaerobium]|uniref:nickel-dependent lactate racemase n=1 Tax=unclassified Halanaerobium TaxID=2641197 RepID=UPI000E12898C|nr:MULTISPECIES: nickel-dependent lactate racemase [unclassified Halanaerobium]RCW41691.1 nickel-dependent lactate racemase [Halanaerobium sp. MA284_MarDTE_T2]RCW79476.1 nickel-dependent lactate racemase [Halanaerobium sp. DL-01]